MNLRSNQVDLLDVELHVIYPVAIKMLNDE